MLVRKKADEQPTLSAGRAPTAGSHGGLQCSSVRLSRTTAVVQERRSMIIPNTPSPLKDSTRQDPRDVRSHNCRGDMVFLCFSASSWLPGSFFGSFFGSLSSGVGSKLMPHLCCTQPVTHWMRTHYLCPRHRDPNWTCEKCTPWFILHTRLHTVARSVGGKAER